jgi:hypothetical protein
MVKATLPEAQSTHVNQATYRKSRETGIQRRAPSCSFVGATPR